MSYNHDIGALSCINKLAGTAYVSVSSSHCWHFHGALSEGGHFEKASSAQMTEVTRIDDIKTVATVCFAGR